MYMIKNKRKFALFAKIFGLFIVPIALFYGFSFYYTNLSFNNESYTLEDMHNELLPSQGTNTPWGIRINFPNDPRNSATIAWFTTNSPSDQKVEYGISSGSYSMQAASQFYKLGEVYLSYANLEGLTPNTRYFYRVGSTTDGWSEEYNFTTAPQFKDYGRKSIHFAAFGDSRSNREARRMVANLILQNSTYLFGSLPEFILHDGDFVSDGEKTELWDYYFDDMNPLLANVPIYPAPGNHEFGGLFNLESFYLENFFLPQNSGTEWYYSFNWGFVHVLSLDSESHGIPPFNQFNQNWLKFDLEKSYSDSNILWKVALFHQPYFTSGGHSERDDLRRAWAPLFDQFGVDIVFNGHNHNYERIYPINANKEYISSENTTYLNLDRPIYITTGCAAMGNPNGLPSNPKPYSYLFNASWHYCDINVSIDLNTNTTTMEVYVIASTSTDDLNNIFLLDHFTITKNIPQSFFEIMSEVDYNYPYPINNQILTIYSAIIIIGIVFVYIIILRKRHLSLKRE